MSRKSVIGDGEVEVEWMVMVSVVEVERDVSWMQLNLATINTGVVLKYSLNICEHQQHTTSSKNSNQHQRHQQQRTLHFIFMNIFIPVARRIEDR